MTRNIAGHDVSIFLFQYVLRNNGISYVLNEAIAQDMYPDIQTKMEPLVQACGDTLLRYKHLCSDKIIMDGNILVDGCFEVMLSKGLGIHFANNEKQNLFSDAHEIAKLLIDVMDRRSLDEESGIVNSSGPVISKIKGTESTNDGLEALALKKEAEQPVDNSYLSHLKRLHPDDLPEGVKARKGYDHRGHCYAFEHVTLGDLGKIVLSVAPVGVKIEAEINNIDSSKLPLKKQLFKEIVVTIEKSLKQLK